MIRLAARAMLGIFILGFLMATIYLVSAVRSGEALKIVIGLGASLLQSWAVITWSEIIRPIK